MSSPSRSYLLVLLLALALPAAPAWAQPVDCDPPASEGSGQPSVAARVEQALCLKEAALVLLAEAGPVGRETPAEYTEAVELIDEAAALLDGAGAEEPLAQLLLDAALAMRAALVFNYVMPAEEELLARRDAYLTGAAQHFAALGGGVRELQALRGLSYPSPAQLARRVALAEAVEGPRSLGLAADIEQLSWAQQQDDPVAAAGSVVRAIAIREGEGPGSLEVAELHLRLGLLEGRNGNRDASRGAYERALAIYQAQAAQDRISYVSLYLGSYALEAGDLPTAQAYYEQALSAADSPRGEGEARIGLALAHLLSGDEPEARRVIGSGSPPSWAILTSEFNRYFMRPTSESGIKAAAERLFGLTGPADAADAIRDSWE